MGKIAWSKQIKWLIALSFWALTSQQGLAQTILSAQGWGETPQIAQQNALQELAQLVYSAVQSDITLQQELNRHQHSQSVNSMIRIQSGGFFQGVQYSDPYHEFGQITVHAHLNAQAIKQTISQIKQALAVEFNTLNRTQLEQALEQAVFLNSFLNIIPPGLVDSQAEKNHAQALRQQIYKYLNYAQLRLFIQPSHAQVELGKQTFDHQASQLIAPGTLPYKIYAQGYHSREGRLQLSPGENRQLTIALIPAFSGQINIEVRGHNRHAVFEQARLQLARYGLTHQTLTEQNITLRLKLEPTFLTEINSVRFYNLRLVAEVTKDSKSVLVRIANVKQVTDSTMEARTRAMINSLIDAVLVHEGFKMLYLTNSL
ncbi:hypothetical protein P8S54_10710 [Thiomicrospira sp. R3]|uniref:hypothetical protein n=1 Tax=Thiomicrospira sp. R3 TaxID=3035472 RepID=UPI00259B4E87|nr:hypothetical protein [Thiomicrospira sp. R3]WFE68664.1 hypothetical protein P8S54_10710 [Thiomicrospira sp. R3]